jgi:hypothetical protein
LPGHYTTAQDCRAQQDTTNWAMKLGGIHICYHAFPNSHALCRDRRKKDQSQRYTPSRQHSCGHSHTS